MSFEIIWKNCFDDATYTMGQYWKIAVSPKYKYNVPMLVVLVQDW